MDDKTNSVSSMDNILNVINRVNESFTYNVWIPSLKREVPFRELNTSQQKRLIKSIIDSPIYNTQFILTMFQIIKENCAENIDFSKLTILDKFFIAFTMRSVSVNDIWEMEFGKNNKRGFSLSKIIEEAKKDINLPGSKDVIDGPYTITCNIPLIETEYNIEKELRNTNINQKIDDLEVKTTENIRKLMGDVFVTELIKYIEKISIKKSADEIIEITFDNKISSANKISILERLPAKLIDGIASYINDVKKEIDKVVLFKTTVLKDNPDKPGEKIEENIEERLDLNGRFFIKS